MKGIKSDQDCHIINTETLGKQYPQYEDCSSALNGRVILHPEDFKPHSGLHCIWSQNHTTCAATMTPGVSVYRHNATTVNLDPKEFLNTNF